MKPAFWCPSRSACALALGLLALSSLPASTAFADVRPPGHALMLIGDDAKGDGAPGRTATRGSGSATVPGPDGKLRSVPADGQGDAVSGYVVDDDYGGGESLSDPGGGGLVVDDGYPEEETLSDAGGGAYDDGRGGVLIDEGAARRREEGKEPRRDEGKEPRRDEGKEPGREGPRLARTGIGDARPVQWIAGTAAVTGLTCLLAARRTPRRSHAV